MGQFFFIMLHYVKRMLRDMPGLPIILLIPVGIIVLNSLATDPFMLDGYNVIASFVTPIMMLAFQFFNMGFLHYVLYKDFKGDMRWRLRAAPLSLMAFMLPAFAAGWIFSIICGTLILFVSALFLNAYLGNLLVLAAVLLLVSLMSTFLAMLIFLFVPKVGTANAIVYILSFGLLALSGAFFPLGNSAVAEFMLTRGTPLVIGQRAILYSGSLNDLVPALGGGMSAAMTNLGILAAITAVLALTTLIAARGRKI
ncbi:MAG: hypothetical protein FWD84_07070 [Oscillospiraceae bacterium]|nr:hypothetical protein [Oscillospiraceae bacterium]